MQVVNATSDIVIEDKKSKHNINIILFTVIAILGLIALDQYFKVYIKTTMQLHTETKVLGDWFRLHFTENPGMAFGLELDFLGGYGKLTLTLFRLIAVVFGFYLLAKQIKRGAHKGFLFCIALILAGAIGNLIDSIFYGVIFKDINYYVGGYFHGHVVDMLYFPVIQGHYWSWIPKLGGQDFTFFSPVFNLADAFISTGAIAIFVFQGVFFPKAKKEELIPDGEDLPDEFIDDGTAGIVQE